MTKLTLRDLIESPDRYHPSLLILVPKDEALQPATEVALQEAKWPMLPVPDGMRVMFDIDTVTHVLEAWVSYSKGRSPSVDEAARAIAHYDECDAFIDPGSK